MGKKATRNSRPAAGSEITDFVMRQPLFGAHSHIWSVKDWAATPACFSAIAGYAAADLVTAAGPVGVGKSHLPAEDHPDYARRYFELWRASRFTGYCRATELACRDLIGVEYVEENAEAIGKAIPALIGEDARASYREILRERANIKWLIKDTIDAPEQMADDMFPPDLVRFAYRDDELLSIGSRADIADREARWQRSVHSVRELVDALNESISGCLATGKITSLKIGLPYRRGIAFGEPTLHDAERTFSRLMNVTPGVSLDVIDRSDVRVASRLSAEELLPLQDYLVHQYVRRAEAEDLGVQVHTGYLAGNRGVLNNISAMDMVPFIVRYPRVRFDLFHAGWPYTEEHAVIGKEFPNVWLDLCWAWTMNPVTMEQTLDSCLACVPHTKIFAYGGDTMCPICEYGYAQQARAGIARVLERWIERDDMTLDDAEDVARHIMLQNGCLFHSLEE